MSRCLRGRLSAFVIVALVFASAVCWDVARSFAASSTPTPTGKGGIPTATWAIIAMAGVAGVAGILFLRLRRRGGK